jgi:hypothetical protein
MRSNYAQDSLYPGESRKVLIQLDSFTMDLPAHISLEEQNDLVREEIISRINTLSFDVCPIKEEPN